MPHIPGISTIVSWTVKTMPNALLRAYYTPERIERGVSIEAHGKSPQITVSRDRPSQITKMVLQIAVKIDIKVLVRYLRADVFFAEKYLGKLERMLDLTISPLSSQSVELEMDLQDSAANSIRGRSSGSLTLTKGIAALTVAGRNLSIPLGIEMTAQIIEV